MSTSTSGVIYLFICLFDFERTFNGALVSVFHD
jgi:hypothetical protein